MKKQILLFLFLGMIHFGFSQSNMGIGTETPDASAILELQATNKGLLIPRTDTTAITSPATGLLIYQLTNNTFYYFDGIIWRSLTASVPSGQGFIHYIGELYGGGIIVAVWKELGVEKGLIASLTDLSADTVWSNVTSTTIGVAAQSPFDGQANTNAILAQPGHIISAAKLCDDYSSGGFSDWYLPAQWELALCASSAYIINNVLGATNGFKFTVYWSSTEYDDINAWGEHLKWNYTYTAGYKYDSHKIRAVRKF